MISRLTAFNVYGVLRQKIALRDFFSGLFCCNGYRLYALKFQYAARFLKLHVMYVVCILNCGNLGLWLGLRAPLMGLSTVYWHGTRTHEGNYFLNSLILLALMPVFAAVGDSPYTKVVIFRPQQHVSEGCPHRCPQYAYNMTDSEPFNKCLSDRS